MLLLGPIVDENGCSRANVFNCVPTSNVYVCLVIILFFNMLNFLVRQKRGDFLCWKEKIMLVKLEHEKKSQWRCGPIVFSDPSKDKTSVCYHNKAASP